MILGNFLSALAMHQYLYKINKKLFIETNPIPVKEALAMMNFIKREIRLPLYYLSDENHKILEGTLKEYKLI